MNKEVESYSIKSPEYWCPPTACVLKPIFFLSMSMMPTVKTVAHTTVTALILDSSTALRCSVGIMGVFFVCMMYLSIWDASMYAHMSRCLCRHTCLCKSPSSRLAEILKTPHISDSLAVRSLTHQVPRAGF